MNYVNRSENVLIETKINIHMLCHRLFRIDIRYSISAGLVVSYTFPLVTSYMIEKYFRMNYRWTHYIHKIILVIILYFTLLLRIHIVQRIRKGIQRKKNMWNLWSYVYQILFSSKWIMWFDCPSIIPMRF